MLATTYQPSRKNPKSHSISQQDSYESLGFSNLGLERVLESQSPLWSIDSSAVMPSSTRVLDRIMDVFDGENIRVSIGTLRNG